MCVLLKKMHVKIFYGKIDVFCIKYVYKVFNIIKSNINFLIKYFDVFFNYMNYNMICIYDNII